MKKVILILVSVLIVINLHGQEDFPRHDISAGVGLLGHNQVMAMTVDLLGTILTAGLKCEPYKYKFLTPYISYKFNATPRYSIGMNFAYDVNQVKLKVKNETDTATFYDWQIRTRQYYVFSLENNFKYINREYFQLYGSLCFGLTLVNIVETGKKLPLINFQLTPLGYRVGNKIAWILELGYGYKGIINTGLSIRF